jgi:lipoyl(octanoyl) transferase
VELGAEWLGRIDYRDAWAVQHDRVARRQRDEIPDTLLLLEHPPVLTLGRSGDRSHVLVDDAEMARRGIELIPVERGGDITYHGPGQLVGYPIIKLADAGLLLRPFVRALEAAMADLAASYGVSAGRREGYPGCWVEPDSARPRKLGALGLKVERGVTFHGIAINITARLADFELIDPCGLPGLDVTSIAREKRWSAASAQPSTASVEVAARRFAVALRDRLTEAASASRPLVASG